MRNPFLVGSTIYLRPFDLENIAALTAWLNDPEVTRHLRVYRLRMAEEAFLRKISDSESDVVLGIVVREPEQFIGVVGLHHLDVRNRHAEFGISIGEKTAWGNGCGTEATRLMVRYAFDVLNLNRVWLHVSEDNARAVRVYQKSRLPHRGRLRQDTFHDGRYCDALVMAVLRQEWLVVDHDEDA